MTEQYLSTNINAPRRTVTVAATTALNEDADLVIVNTTGLGGAPTITLPDARVVDGRTITIKVPVATVGSGGQNVIVDGLGAQTIDGALTVTIAIDQTALQVQSDNANWRIIGLTDADSGGEIIFGSLFLDSASPSLTIGNGTGSPELILNKSDAGTAEFNMQVAGVTRWDWLFNATEDLLLERRDAGGALVDVPLTFDIAAGNASFANSILQGGAIVANGVANHTNVVIGDGSADVGITFFGPLAGVGASGIAWTDVSGSAQGSIDYDYTNNRFFFRTLNGSNRVIIDSNSMDPASTGAMDLGANVSRWGRGFILGHVLGIEPSAASITVGDNGIIYADASGGNVDVNLPAATITGQYYYIIILDATNNVDITPAGGDTINGAAGAKTIAAGAEGSYIISSDASGSNWNLFGRIPAV